MNCGGAFIFDAESDAALRGVWREAAAASGSNTMLELDYPPHLTFFMADLLDFDSRKPAVDALAEVTAPLEIDIPSLGAFPGNFGVVYLAPIVNQPLLALHEQFYRTAERHCADLAQHYRPGMWIPHITVGFNLAPEAAGTTVTALARAALPRKARITGLTFGQFNLVGASELANVWFKGG